MSEELKALKKQLLKDDRNGYDVLSAADLEKMEAYCTVYKAFLDAGKTERLSARAAIALAEKHGFVEYKRGMSLSAGDKVYSCNRGKGLVLAVVGRRSLAEGAQITAAHIDSPRLDLKPTPLYEDSELAYFKTHYYGGVRKYQWVTIPLELRGTVVLRDGSVVDVCITEADFASAELETVPAVNATDIGLDGSLIGAYGHDDRVCGFAALQAILDIGTPEKTAVCVLADKEEIGSMGVTGMQSAAFDTFMNDLCESQNVALRVCYENAFCLSADVTAAYDPNFADVYEKRNAAFVNHGVGLCKYTGARGKSGSSDANAETVGYVRGVLDKAGVRWQICEMGKIDAGGGGTVAQYMANRNIATLDAGVPVLSMHAPFEVVAKLDCYEMYRACKALYESL